MSSDQAGELFDAAWYATMGGRGDDAEALWRDYLERGEAAGLHPSPLFSPAWYARAADRKRPGSLLHFVRHGGRELLAPHPLVDPTWIAERHPEAREHATGPLGWYLDGGWRTDPATGPLVPAGPLLDHVRPGDGPTMVRFVAAMVDQLGIRGSPVPLTATASEQSGLRRQLASSLPEPPPLISVVMATFDALPQALRAVRSLRRQTYANWELVVVDDASVDGTAQLLEALPDERVRVVHTGRRRGLGYALDRGVRAASGSWVTYLDPATTYEADHLATMVAFASREGARAASCAARIVGGETRTIWGPLDPRSIDHAALLDTMIHERALLDEVGGFDASLASASDWEMLVRLAGHTQVAYAPVVGVTRTVTEAATEAATEAVRTDAELRRADVRRARARRTRAPDPASDPDIVPGRTTVVLIGAGRGGAALTAVERVRDSVDGADVQIVVVDAGGRTDNALLYATMGVRFPDVEVVRSGVDDGYAAAANLGAARADGERLVFLSVETLVEDTWLEPLIDALDDHELAQPLVIAGAGYVLSTGWGFDRGGQPLRVLHGLAERDPAVRVGGERTGVDASAFAVRATAFRQVGGFDPAYGDELGDLDLSLRIRSRFGGRAHYVPESRVVRRRLSYAEGRPSPDAPATVFRSRWGRQPADLEQPYRRAGYAVAGLPVRSADPEQDVTHPVTVLVRDRPARRRWAIKIGAGSVVRREGWGDWHFAQALATELEQLGNEVVIDGRNAWHRPSAHLDDVVLVLRGLHRYEPDRRQCNLLWIISHPDLVSSSEIGRFDASFSASTRHAAILRRSGLDVTTLLQCTDPERFRPATPRSDLARPILFVGNSRGVPRPVVTMAVDAGLPLTLHGRGWEGLAPTAAISSTHVPNEQLADHYRSADVVLNDHWDDMRRWGYLANRLFDVVACGTVVVSDDVPGMRSVFGDAVVTFASPSGYLEAVEEGRRRAADPAGSLRRRSLAHAIREEHSFRSRARHLHAAADRLLRATGS